MITIAKGVTSGYSPMGALLASERLIEPFLHGTASFAHGVTFAGHPVSSAVALANLAIFDDEGLLKHVRDNEEAFRSSLRSLEDLPIVGDIRGAGYFYGIELVKDKATRETFNDEESERLLRGFLSPALFDAGLVCRTDDRGDPVVQLAPTLICEQEHFDLIVEILPRRPRPGDSAYLIRGGCLSGRRCRWPFVAGGFFRLRRCRGRGRRGRWCLDSSLFGSSSLFDGFSLF